MSIPISISPSKRRVRRKRRVANQLTTAALTLVSAVYDSDLGAVSLGFDRAIDIENIDGSAIQVNDGAVYQVLFVGDSSSAVQTSPTVVRISLSLFGDSSGDQVLLIASAMTGIIAVDDGATWAGVTDLVLPFP